MTAKLDGRSQKDLARRMLRDAETLLGPDGRPAEPGRIGGAVITTAAGLFEEVTRRLDRVPDKQADNFYTAMGLGRMPAQPATMPLAITISDTAPDDLVAPIGTKLTADTGGVPTIFETTAGIALAHGRVSAVGAADLAADRILLAPGAVVTPALPRPVLVSRFVRSPAVPGATMLQIDPAQGLATGMTLRFGTGGGTAEYDVVKVENGVVTITPALGEQVGERAPVTEVDIFAPFESGTRNRQLHALYLSHSTLLDIPAGLTISVGGVASQQVVDWQWFGRRATDPESSAPRWQGFETDDFTDGIWRLTKAKGKPEKTDVVGRNGLWIRGRLAAAATLTEQAGPITLAVAGGVCSVDHHTRCDSPETPKAPAIDFEAVAVTTPVVPNKPFYPFGREPRLFDAFHVGCAEAFGKAGGEASLCFTMGGATLGQLAAVSNGGMTLVFGVGTDRQLYAATFTEGRPVFAPVPSPRLAGRPVAFAQQATLHARIDRGYIRLAVAGDGAVHVVAFAIGTPMTEGRMRWQTLAMDKPDADNPVDALFVSTDEQDLGGGLVHAKVGDRILAWTWKHDGAVAAQAPIDDAIDLIPVQGTDIDAALIVLAGEKTGSGDAPVEKIWQIDVKPGTGDERRTVARIKPHSLPDRRRAAWASSSDFDAAAIVVAGYDAIDAARTRLRLLRVDDRGRDWHPEIDEDETSALPITFEPGDIALARSTGDTPPPAVIIATSDPIRFVARDTEHYERTAGTTSIGTSLNGDRGFVTLAGRSFVQSGDQGLLYRNAEGDSIAPRARFAGFGRYGATAEDVPAAAIYFVATRGANGEGFVLAADGDGNRLFLPLAGDPSPTDQHGKLAGSLLEPDGESGGIAITTTGFVLTDSSGSTSGATRSVYLSLTDVARRPLGIWQLDYNAPAAEWRLPPNSDPPTGATSYTLLRVVQDPGGQAVVSLPARDHIAFDPAEALRLEALLATGPLISYYGGHRVGAVAFFDEIPAIQMDIAELDGPFLTLLLAQTNWSVLGPDQPANPALSWEYWNGTSWWALDSDSSGFFDGTGNLLVDGGVYFRMPGDLQETEVGGRRNRWIRARLVGGDYGEARVTVHTDGAPPDQSQTITRDLSAIRAPYVVDLKIGYCARTPTTPEIVLTADNLDTLDQTQANEAGLPVTLFQTVADALIPDTGAVAPVSDVADCCGTPVSPEPEPDTVSSALSASRILLIGFDQPLRGSPLSLHIDALPVGGGWSVEAAIYRKGRFEPARVLSDGSNGLGESGIIAIELLAAPDRAQLLGTSACWLRLSPPPAIAARWSPRLRGVYLNGVTATSVETRLLETLGTSTGAPDQVFRLSTNPVDGDSIDLRVSEPVGDDEGGELGALPDIEGMPGPWVAWTLAPEFPPDDRESPARLFTVDEQRGTIGFGNGRNALVPPMGSAILARRYRHVTGMAANAVAAGARLQPVSPIAGMDRVTALDTAQGGADVEAPDQARARAPTKLLNGGRIVTLHDVEDHVLARLPTVSQARAAPWRGGTRLVVVGRGVTLVLPPAALNAIADQLHDVAAFGLAASGRLSVVAPRLLDARVDVTIDVDPGTDYAGVAEEAKHAIAAFFHPETGGYDARGWPVGASPTATDVSTALAGISAHAVVSDIVIARSQGTRRWPDPLPADVLVRVARAAVTVHAFAEASA